MRSTALASDRALVRTASRLADNISTAIRRGLDPDKIAEEFLQEFPLGSQLSPEQARDWARVNILQDTKELSRAMDLLYAAGWILGEDLGNQLVAEAKGIRLRTATKAPAPKPPKPPKLDPKQPTRIDWSNWKPGSRAAEALLRPKGGLSNLLNRTKPTTIQGISQTNLDRIGTALADVVALGLTDLEAAKKLISLKIRGIAKDPQRALSIANTEMNRAMSVASMDTYNELDLDRVEWFALEGCDFCEENAEAGPIPMGSVFPSGDTEPPAHPNCRCSILPYIEEDSSALRD
jgi:hypothetical protein